MHVRTSLRSLLGLLACAALTVPLGGCGEDDAAPSRLPYNDNETVIISGSGTTVHETPDGTACIELPSGECIQPQDACGDDAHADVLLDSEGQVIEIVCYPTEENATIVEAEDGSAKVPDNGAVVVLGDDDIDGDLTVEGNRGTIFGDSPDDTVIDGNLSLRGNETVVRGVRVKGDVNFDGNKSTLLFCVIEGDVNFSGGDNFISNCTVFGAINSTGNGDRLLTNYLQNEMSFTGQPGECRDNMRFVDEDSDFVLDAQEADAATPAACP